MQAALFQPAPFFAALIVSSVGFVVFVYGKRMARWPHLVSGLILMAYPYFVPALLPMLGTAIVILAALVLLVRLGH